MATDSDDRRGQVGRILVLLVGAVVALLVGWWAFVVVPGGSLGGVVGVLLTILTVVLGIRLAGRVAQSRFPGYNVAEVAVEGPISRDGGGRFPSTPGGAHADQFVDQIDAANDDQNVNALIVRLNTPGGEVVPSDDIRLAVERFEGPTVAYATDVCASGGYWIASGCDELWARDASIVGSIGVIGSRVNATELADKLGLSYERFAAGKFKDAGTPLKELSEPEREYLQGIIDDLYDHFVSRVTAARDLTEAEVRATEAKVYLGEEALNLGLVDALGTRDDVEDRVAELLGVESVSVVEFTPQRRLVERFSLSAERIAYAAGAGVGRVLTQDGEQGEMNIRL
ncbi:MULTISPECIES: signal peptide peptidase SppA [unclassified Haladaptatus]|uniref:signal peptide peptidase SppA n=1 Tax=unclassified Haladaptatus TaxID=2622732 RepID=UPI0023E7BEE3|nr:MULTISPECIES: signal peptide peptidase SppA [unclassified Haladaptatus]